MYLKRLDILGFKSFANKTTIHFAHGITAVVGPNGCGKTNILDALRWVLGEQKTSLLRGSKMEEVIFNGTSDVKALGMAEVTLTLVNNRGVLPTEYSEIQITRRLFRSGESEYLINKVPCRLKDIHELFYDTGVGAHSYSVIQQDMIDSVISDKAEERRFLFEEAAGITKYKQRKRAALRKLDATQQDLLRLRDIFAEVQTQVRSLKRQYKKAERYQSVIEEVRAWELYLGSRRIKALDKEKREIRGELDALGDRMVDRESNIDRLSAAIEEERKEQVDLEHALTEVGNEVYAVTERAHSIEKDISVLTEKRSNARSLVERNEHDIFTLRERARVLGEQTAEHEATLGRQREELESESQRLTEAERVQAEADRRLLEARTDREQENKQLIELEGKLSSGKAEEGNLKEQENELHEQVSDIERQMDENRSRQRAINEELEKHQAHESDLSDRKEETERRLAELTERLETLVEQNQELTEELSNLAASIEACQARKHLLEDMILHFEGYESGVVAAMEEKDRWPGVIGTVADSFVPREGLEIATEAALGEIAGYLICDSRTTAEQIISYLKQESKGRIGILVPDTGTINPGVKRPEMEDRPEFVGWLDTLVSADEQLRPLMQAVLSRTAIFKASSDPSALLQRLPYGFQAVSTDGRVYSKNVIAGGSDDKFPLFRRKEKLEEQDRMIANLEARKEQAQRRKNEVTAQIAATRAESGTRSSTLEDVVEELAECRKDLAEQEYQTRTVQAEIARLERERSAANQKIERIRHRQYSLGLDHNKLAGEKESLVLTMSEMERRLHEFESAASQALERVSQLQVGVVEGRSRIEQTESKLTHLREIRDEIAHTIDEKTREITQARTDIEQSGQRMEQLEAELKKTFEERQEVTSRQARLRSTQSEILERLSAKEKELKELRSDREGISNQRHEFEMRVNTLESEMRAISERIRDEYELEIAEVEAPKPDETIEDEEAIRQLAGKKEQLRKFGAVNLLALDEYKQASEREKFLGEQLEDLTAARTDLQTTISKINQTARQLFHQTFEKVRSNFKKLFVELFSGGEADIRLIDPDDPLESDIDITARPRGKKLLSITMMSGGERALTAISLLFSLYMVKPSPFCILDEIDAPLDDANCRRFLRIIDTFSEQTQFIIITHNKITMEAADNLYGVTMGQPGISQLVAVRFAEDTEGNVVTDTKAADDQDEADDEPVPVTVDREDLPEAIRERLAPPIPTSRDQDNES